MSTDHLATLNRSGASCGLDPVTRSSRKAVYPNSFNGEVAKNSDQRGTHSLHPGLHTGDARPRDAQRMEVR